MEHVRSPELASVSLELVEGRITLAEAERLSKSILEGFKRIRARDAGLDPLFFAEDNLKVLDLYVKREYSHTESKAHSKRMRINDLKRAVGCLAELSIRTADRQDLVTRLKKMCPKVSVYNRMVGCLNSLLRFIKRDIKLYTISQSGREVTVLSEAEVLATVALYEPDFKMLCLVAFATGMRWGECMALEPKQIKINPRTKRAFVYVDKQWNRVEGCITPPKRNKKRDALILPQYLNTVREWASHEKDKTMNNKTPTHIFRHSYAMYLLQQGVSLSLVARFLGNTLKVTEDYYTAYTFGDDLNLPDGL
jgi:integrase